MKFRDWLYFTEIFNVVQSKGGGTWTPPLNARNLANEIYTYRFDLPSERCEGGPCYYVTISVSEGIAGISFGHINSSYKDRFDATKSKDGNPINSAMGVMNYVLEAVSEFVNTKLPKGINWSAVQKSRDGAKNIDSRSKIYDMWGRKFLSKQYTKTASGIWIRNDVLHEFPQYTNNSPEQGWANSGFHTSGGGDWVRPADYVSDYD